jgi:DNA-binding CsgD family transcriptional regulator
MKNQKLKFDLSNDLVLVRFGNGVVLIRPELTSSCRANFYSVAALLKLPFNVFFTNTEGSFYQLNMSTINSLGFDSVEDSIGRVAAESANKETIIQITTHDKAVVEEKRQLYKEIVFTREIDHDVKRYICIKFPLYDYKQNKVAGIFGVALMLDPPEAPSFPESLSLLTQTNLLASEPSYLKNILAPLKVDQVHFSCREKDVLHYIMLGKRTKEIAAALSLSPRTVEEYISNIKNKLNVISKSSIVEKILAYSKK